MKEQKNTSTHIQGIPFEFGTQISIGSAIGNIKINNREEEYIGIDWGEGTLSLIRFDAKLYQEIRLNPYTIPPDPEPTLYDMVEEGDTVWSCISGETTVYYKKINGRGIQLAPTGWYYKEDGRIDKTSKHPHIFLSRKHYNEYWDAQDNAKEVK